MGLAFQFGFSDLLFVPFLVVKDFLGVFPNWMLISLRLLCLLTVLLMLFGLIASFSNEGSAEGQSVKDYH